MNSDLIIGVVLYGGLLVLYRLNEPRAREQDRKRSERREQPPAVPHTKGAQQPHGPAATVPIPGEATPRM